ncbi:MAG: UDP-N-acetylmuramoyl-L-alanine--D-glutamate ligase [Candidatus Nitronauta litoralis]|uniref:UDP-N-acetylmuramoylalanine--D-glutamate ligase n=1 Tax=Candidatus Nitronauta litoralis TaxID=2705533 RepID=A0A7T0BTG8_9BACT|nr:MAG: UDP-N-acetylmuramoyl-L-alanine--D-glutamate ligase [Candidatus Nitronauta litoralis]
MDVKGKKVSVLGMARSGISIARFLIRQGAYVTLFDSKSKEELKERAALLPEEVDVCYGSCVPAIDSDLVVLSPGIDIESPDLDTAKQKGIEIVGELELTFRFFNPPVIAITGTNGKSTTTMLVGELLKEAGLDIAVGGNIGTPFSELLKNPPKDFAVIEVSSFQLETIRDFRPKIAAILNLTPDHLDRHGSLEHYAALKKRLTENQQLDDVLVLNADDKNVSEMRMNSKAKLINFSLTEKPNEGACVSDGKIMVYQNELEQPIISVEALPSAAKSQLENVLAAIAIAHQAEVPVEVMQRVIKNFKGLEHRLEWVRNIEGVDYVNDSKGTNLGALEKSLSGFDRPVVLIMGGQDKGSDFLTLKPLFKKRVKHMVLIGEARQKIRATLNGSFTYEDADSMEEAVRVASIHAEPGDLVLLSPGCASFDMFRDYEDRGRQFKEFVNKL